MDRLRDFLSRQLADPARWLVGIVFTLCMIGAFALLILFNVSTVETVNQDGEAFTSQVIWETILGILPILSTQ